MSRQPAEWEPHSAVWTAWPSHGELWEDDLTPALEEVAAMVRAIWDDGRGERPEILTATDRAHASASRLLAGTGARIHFVPFGDIWLRDTGPLFLKGAAGLAAAGFRFNGWGGKYHYPEDEGVSAAVCEIAGVPLARHDWILEGGAIDVDGTGLVVTTEQCLLNPNRNPHMDRAEIEARLRRDLGLERVLWLGDGLVGDHTDGHVDNLARFVAPGVLALPAASGSDDPNRDVFADAMERARDFGVEVVTIPSPGLVLDDEGEVIPASHMNFYIGNTTVVVPVYGTAYDDAAVDAVGRLFPGRRVIGLSADSILTGGGSFHCITQQQPL